MALAIIFDSVGVGEWLVLLAVVLVVVGPKRLPSTARTIGKHYSRFRRAADSFKRQLLEMDTEITNAVESAAKEAEEAVGSEDLTDDVFDYGGDDRMGIEGSQSYDEPAPDSTAVTGEAVVDRQDTNGDETP